jgi:hypothetical protein
MDPGLLLEVVRLHLFEALRDIQARLSNRLARAVLELCCGGPLPELPRPRCLSRRFVGGAGAMRAMGAAGRR